MSTSESRAAAHLCHISVLLEAQFAGSSLAPRRDWDSPDLRCRDAVTAQDQLGCLGSEHLPSPVATAKLQGLCRATAVVGHVPWVQLSLLGFLSAPPGLFQVFLFVSVLGRLGVILLKSLDERNSARHYGDTTQPSCTKCLSGGSVLHSRGMAGTRYILGRARTVSEGKIPPSGITCTTARHF